VPLSCAILKPMATTADRRPVLWHLQLSHFNEKVRWALDLKRIDHVRRPLLPECTCSSAGT
jgi:hypothetical protein